MIKHYAPKFQEEYSAKLPALTLLNNLGWSFISPDQALQKRGGKFDQVILADELKAQLRKRNYQFEGETCSLSEKSIDALFSELSNPGMNEGLLTANEKIYNHLLYGISVTEFVEGKKTNPTIAIIDWQNLHNNSFLFTEEFSVTRAGGIETRRPDIVCFVNGIPLVVIEAKRPDSKSSKGPTVQEGVSQTIRNQRPDEIPLLYTYSQLLVSISGVDARYGTCATPDKFWAAWREEDSRLPRSKACLSTANRLT